MKYAFTNRFLILLLIILGGIFINVLGVHTSSILELPLWLDSIGTVVAAFLLGPVCGFLTGFLSNISYAVAYSDYGYALYAVTNGVIGWVVGKASVKDKFNTLGSALNVSMVVVIATMCTAIPLNLIFHGGMTSNVWGDAVIAFLQQHDFKYLSYAIGEFYVDFLDKVLVILLVYMCISISRRLGQRKEPEKNLKSLTAALLAVIFFAVSSVPDTAEAHQNEPNDSIYAFQQTIYGNDNGLQGGESNDIAQTRDGVLWIATYSGLLRYSGKDFRVVKKSHLVRSVNCLYTDDYDRLWVGTNGLGVSVFKNEELQMQFNSQRALPANTINEICSDHNSRYYICTPSGLAIINGENHYVTEKIVRHLANVKSIDSSDSGLVCLVNYSGNRLYLFSEGKIVNSYALNSANNKFLAVCFSKHGDLYAVTSDNSLYRFRINPEEKFKFVLQEQKKLSDINNVKSLYFDSISNTLFLCSDNGIYYVTSTGHFHKLHSPGFENSVESMTVDYQGNYWFTSSRLGLLKLSKAAAEDVYQTVGLKDSVVNATVIWQDYLFCGTDKGLDIIAMKINQPVENQYTSALKGIRIRCIYKDSRDCLWICTYGKGLYKIDKNGSMSIITKADGLFGNYLKNILELDDHTMIAGGPGGYSVIDQEGRVTTPNQEVLKEIEFLCFYQMPDGSVLGGTDGSGIAVIVNGKLRDFITTREGLLSESILRIKGSSRYKLTYVITTNGLQLLDQRGFIRDLKSFPYYNNFDIWDGKDGKIIVTSSAGIFIVDENELLKGGILNYEQISTFNGLPFPVTANSWNYFDEASGMLYLGAQNGVLKLDINNYSIKDEIYRANILSVSLDDDVYYSYLGLPKVIDRNVQKVKFTTEIINYTKNDPTVSYFLEGLETVENTCLASELADVTYNNLNPGTYIFHLNVIDDETGNVITHSFYQFEKKEELYDTIKFLVYFYVVAGLALIFITSFVVRYWAQRTIEAQRLKIELAEQQINMSNQTILTIAKALDARDQRTQKHSARVAKYSVLIARELGFDDKSCENLKKVALLHDLGKIGIPDRILNKPDKLTDEEYAVMKSHVTIGAEILKNFTSFEHITDGVLYHHERYDGKGYVKGLKGEEIPIYGRIIAVADAFDAMAANRIYRKQLDISVVLDQIEKGKGKQFDPKCAEIMLNLVRTGVIDISKLYPVPKSQSETDKADDSQSAG